jgi:hypothetical protein
MSTTADHHPEPVNDREDTTVNTPEPEPVNTTPTDTVNTDTTRADRRVVNGNVVEFKPGTARTPEDIPHPEPVPRRQRPRSSTLRSSTTPSPAKAPAQVDPGGGQGHGQDETAGVAAGQAGRGGGPVPGSAVRHRPAGPLGPGVVSATGSATATAATSVPAVSASVGCPVNAGMAARFTASVSRSRSTGAVSAARNTSTGGTECSTIPDRCSDPGLPGVHDVGGEERGSSTRTPSARPAPAWPVTANSKRCPAAPTPFPTRVTPTTPPNCHTCHSVTQPPLTSKNRSDRVTALPGCHGAGTTTE